MCVFLFFFINPLKLGHCFCWLLSVLLFVLVKYWLTEVSWTVGPTSACKALPPYLMLCHSQAPLTSAKYFGKDYKVCKCAERATFFYCLKNVSPTSKPSHFLLLFLIRHSDVLEHYAPFRSSHFLLLSLIRQPDVLGHYVPFRSGYFLLLSMIRQPDV